jgi:reverse gyrase
MAGLPPGLEGAPALPRGDHAFGARCVACGGTCYTKRPHNNLECIRLLRELVQQQRVRGLQALVLQLCISETPRVFLDYLEVLLVFVIKLLEKHIESGLQIVM